MAALLIIFIFQAVQNFRRLPKPSATVDERWTKLAEVSQAETGIPVVIGSGFTFLEAAKYAPPGLRERLVEVVHADITNRLITMDSVDKANHLLMKFLYPLRIQAPHPKFLLHSASAIG